MANVASQAILSVSFSGIQGQSKCFASVCSRTKEGRNPSRPTSSIIVSSSPLSDESAHHSARGYLIKGIEANVPFYYFSLSEGRLVTFYRFQEKRLVQLIAAWRKLQFPTPQNRKRQLFSSRSTTSIGRKISLEVNRSTNANSRLLPAPQPG